MDSAKSIDEFLEHFGVRGMRWGVTGGSSGIIGLESDNRRQNIKDGANIAKSLLRQISKKRMSDMPSVNEIHYGSQSFNIVKLVEKLVAATS